MIVASTVLGALAWAAVYSWTGLFSADSTSDYLRELPARVVAGFVLGGVAGFVGARGVLALHESLTASTKVRASRTVSLASPFDEALEACRAAAEALPSEIERVDAHNGLVRAKVPASFWSRGERLSFHVARTTSSDGTEVTVSSRPTHRITLLDYGKNDDNVARAISLLETRPEDRAHGRGVEPGR